MTMTGTRGASGSPEPTLGLAGAEPAGNVAADEPANGGGQLVEVAVDAPGAGQRRFTYRVPERLAGLEPGEAVLVEFGRRQALAIVLGPATGRPARSSRSPTGSGPTGPCSRRSR